MVKTICIKTNSTIISATLNNTIAAQDFYSKLPLSLKFIDSGIDYCCNYSQGKYAIDEMQKGWKKGDIIWYGGFLSINYLDEIYSFGYNVMVIGHIEKEDLKLIKNLPKEILLEFKPHNHF